MTSRRSSRLVALSLGLAVMLAGAATPAAAPAYARPAGSVAGASTPVSRHGQLHVCGRRLCDEAGGHVQLRGMSTHGTQWYAGCITPRSLDALAGTWGADVLRVSTYVQEGGYATNPRLFTKRAARMVRQATARGMYVIIDWHLLEPGDPFVNLDRARRFFAAMTHRFADQDNVFYEIANEPNGVSWSRVRAYAEELIPDLRAADPDAPILVGTAGWSSFGVADGHDPRQVVRHPVRADNIAYTFHFYAASHGADYRRALARASRRLPVFVTEFGTQRFTGNGPDDFASARRYLSLMNKRGISWVNWNYSDDRRSGAVFETGTCPRGPFSTDAVLKPAGEWVRDRIRAGIA